MQTIKKHYHHFRQGGKNKLLLIEYGISETNHRYFSITGTIGYGQGGSYRDGDFITDQHGNKFRFEMAGCIHEEITKRTGGKFNDLIELHLADADTGKPMYAFGNGHYHYKEKGLDYAADYLHLNDEQRASLKVYLAAHITSEDGFRAFVEDMAPAWQAKANSAKEKYGLTKSLPVHDDAA